MRKRWTAEMGFTREGAKCAEQALPLAKQLLRTVQFDVGAANAVLREAWYRMVELPRRTKKFQARYNRINRT